MEVYDFKFKMKIIIKVKNETGSSIAIFFRNRNQAYIVPAF